MMRRSFVAAACVVFGSSAAFAQDARVLGRDDVEFADALDDEGYPDLAKRLRRIIPGSDGDSEDTTPQRAAMRARKIDSRALELFKSDPQSREGDTLWRRAADFYELSVAPQVAGAATADPDELRGVADRLFVFGRHFNGVPESRVGFVDWWTGRTTKGACWRKAVPINEAALAASADDRTAIQLGRTLGFLRIWPDAVRVYAKVFAQTPILTKKTQKLDLDVVKARPELVLAYLEWGVAEQEAAAWVVDERARDDHLNRCIGTILMPLALTITLDANPEPFWGANYHLVRALMDKELYKDALAKIEDLMRSVSPTVDGQKFDGGKFGYQALFEATLRELR